MSCEGWENVAMGRASGAGRRMRWLLQALPILAVIWPSCAIVDTCDVCGSRPLALDQSEQPQLLGGVDASPGSWPWMVSLQLPTLTGHNHTCGGSLITARWVLTAAHCFRTKRNLPHWRAVVGATQLSLLGPEVHVRFIKQVVIHEDYTPGTEVNDIALMEMDQPVTCSEYIQPACLPDSTVKVPTLTECYIGGWGVLRKRATKMLDIMQEAKVDRFPVEQCNSTNWYKGKIQENNLCAGYEKAGINSCQGDSGGPLMCKEEGSQPFWVIGVTSWSRGCAKARKPVVYTATQPFYSWVSGWASPMPQPPPTPETTTPATAPAPTLTHSKPTESTTSPETSPSEPATSTEPESQQKPETEPQISPETQASPPPETNPPETQASPPPETNPPAPPETQASPPPETQPPAPPETQASLPPETHAPPETHLPLPPETHAPPETHLPLPPETHPPPETHLPLPPETHPPPETHLPLPPETHVPPETHLPLPPSPSKTQPPPQPETQAPPTTTQPPGSSQASPGSSPPSETEAPPQTPPEAPPGAESEASPQPESETPPPSTPQPVPELSLHPGATILIIEAPPTQTQPGPSPWPETNTTTTAATAATTTTAPPAPPEPSTPPALSSAPPETAGPPALNQSEPGKGNNGTVATFFKLLQNFLRHTRKGKGDMWPKVTEVELIEEVNVAPLEEASQTPATHPPAETATSPCAQTEAADAASKCVTDAKAS